MKNKKHFICLILIFILVIISILIVVIPPNTVSSTNYEIIDKNTIGEFTKNNKIEQDFIANQNYKKIGLYYANYGKLVTKGYIDIKIVNDSNKVKDRKIYVGNLLDNSFCYVNYGFKKDHKYKIIVSANKIDYPITFYTTTKNIVGSSLKIDDKQQNVNLVLAFAYYKKDYFSLWYCLLLISLILCYMIFIDRDGVTNE